jgi:hypothetical protein
MKYQVQKILLKNCTVYNILFESNILGHVIDHPNSKIIVQTDELPIIPIAESLGFEGDFYAANKDGYELVNLKSTDDLKPIYEYKIINLQDYFLNEEVTSK